MCCRICLLEICLYWLLYGMELQKNSQEEEEEEGEMMFSTTLWKLYINRYFGQQLVFNNFHFLT